MLAGWPEQHAVCFSESMQQHSLLSDLLLHPRPCADLQQRSSTTLSDTIILGTIM